MPPRAGSYALQLRLREAPLITSNVIIGRVIYEHAAVMLVSTIDQMITSGFNATLEECGGEFDFPLAPRLD